MSVQTSSGVALRYLSSSRTERKVAADFGLELRCANHARSLFEGAILQQPSEQQVARLEQCDVLGVDEFALRKQPSDLQIEKGRRDDEELTGFVELVLGIQPTQVGDESSVTRLSEISVMSSSCLEMSDSRRSNGP